MNDRGQPMRAVAARVLQSVENGQSLTQCLPPALNDVADNERPQLQALCYGTCRWFHRLDAELEARLRPDCAPPDAGGTVPTAL